MLQFAVRIKQQKQQQQQKEIYSTKKYIYSPASQAHSQTYYAKDALP